MPQDVLFSPQEAGKATAEAAELPLVFFEALAGLKVDGVFLGMAASLTEMDPALTREQGYGGTFAVRLDALTMEGIAAARAEHRRRFAEAPRA